MNADRRENSSSQLLVAPLRRFGRADIPLAGGKGANLGELLQGGFDVPDGFVITTGAYDRMVETVRLRDLIDRSLASLDPQEPKSVERLSAEIRQAIQAATIPDALAEEIRKAYRAHGSGAVAVRSSATAEDLPGAAFAGQQETFLNLQGEQAVLEAVRDCWASLWSERAVLYRARQGVDQTAVKLAVVVQKMVDAEAAGVMFSANPGLGEAVVAGMVTPDHTVVDKRTGRVKEHQSGRREVIVRAKPGGGTEQVKTDADDVPSPVLPEVAVRELAGLGRRIERHFGVPQDIEWTWSHNGSQAGSFLIVQARPMTALPEPIVITGPMRMVVPMLIEMWTVRPYPLDMTTFTGAVERAIGQLLTSLIGSSAPDPDKALVEEDGVVVCFRPPQMHPRPAMFVTLLAALGRTHKYDPTRWQDDAALGEFIARARQADAQELQSLTWTQNLDLLKQTLGLASLGMSVRQRYLPWAALRLALLWLSLRRTGHADRLGVLISGIETKTVETNRTLEGLAAQIRANASLREAFAGHESGELQPILKKSGEGREFLKNFDAFLRDYGHRETTLAVSQPAWKDQPEFVLGILKVLAGGEPKRADHEHDWQQARDELLRSTVLGRWPFRPAFRKWLADARALFQIREDTHFYATMIQPTVRRIVLELGGRLREAGALDQAEEVFHLRLDELERLGEPWPPSKPQLEEVRALVARRKAKREGLAGTPMVDPRLLRQSPGAEADRNIILRGSSGGPGVAVGSVRVVHDSSEFGNLQADEILVAPSTNPAWTPLFQRAAAVVVDTGGAASHAAIVAREYGIPAVMGTVDGTQRLKDGQRVRVDGSRGWVLNAEEAE